ncbi:hypothetical protein ACLHDG_05210 [Sulfurovum sp. CS9]|uniref:hypothetical protein n=1 Tax=Sulfurovum sp. CS9 TaxID=3391146 RepID=UPI0039ECEE50
MSIVINGLKKLKGKHIGLAILGLAVIIYLVVKVDRSRIEHLKNGGVLACGAEGKTEIIDVDYRISGSGLAILSKSGQKWSMKKCTPFPSLPVK